MTPIHYGARALCAALFLAAGCATVGKIDTLDDAACRSAFDDGIASILISQKESPEVAHGLARRVASTNVFVHAGPRPFLVASPSGTDYEFFVEVKDKQCMLRLYGRYKGFSSYTNNLTYIATEALPQCRCSE